MIFLVSASILLCCVTLAGRLENDPFEHILSDLTQRRFSLAKTNDNRNITTSDLSEHSIHIFPALLRIAGKCYYCGIIGCSRRCRHEACFIGLTTPVGLLVTPTDRPKSVRNRCVIEVFGGVCVCCPLVFEFSVGIGGFVIGLGQIAFFFS